MKKLLFGGIIALLCLDPNFRESGAPGNTEDNNENMNEQSDLTAGSTAGTAETSNVADADINEEESEKLHEEEENTEKEPAAIVDEDEAKA